MEGVPQGGWTGQCLEGMSELAALTAFQRALQTAQRNAADPAPHKAQLTNIPTDTAYNILI